MMYIYIYLCYYMCIYIYIVGIADRKPQGECTGAIGLAWKAHLQCLGTQGTLGSVKVVRPWRL